MKNFKKVRPKDFDVQLLEKLCNEGKLFVCLEPEDNCDLYKLEVMDYVQRIDDFATEEWRGKTDKLWSAIVEEPCFRNVLMMKNGVQRGHINKYSVTNIVCRLQNLGVYSLDISMLTLHLELEGIQEKNTYYKSSGNYALSREEKTVLRELLQRV